VAVHGLADLVLARLVGAGQALGRRVGAQVKGFPFDLDVIVLLKVVDPIQTDIAPRSYVVGVHLNVNAVVLGGHHSLLCKHPMIRAAGRLCKPKCGRTPDQEI
jgi:hypothetical protein